MDSDTLRRIGGSLVGRVRQMAGGMSEWKGWNLKALDGSSSSMPDTSTNQKAWPQPAGQTKGCGFPVMKWVGIFCLGSGALLGMGCGSLHHHELRLFQQLWDYLKPRDLVVADRGFSSYTMYALFQMKGLAALFRLLESGRGHKRGNKPGPKPMPKHSRKKKIKRLGKGDHLVRWRKPFQKPRWMDDLAWAEAPDFITVRMVAFTVKGRHARAQRITLATTLLDPSQYPAGELAALYARRWEVELLIRNMKTTMKMELLRCKSSTLIEKEMMMHQIAYNMVACLVLESALVYWLDPLCLSYAGALSALQAFANGKPQSKRKQEIAYSELLGTIAVEALPDRPGRKDPRAVKRRPKPYPLLTRPRNDYEEIPHRSKYRKNDNSIKTESLT
ncbi:MAG: IS4 family transposase [Verrucomicrobiales bacterium]